jgi:hypothetical protein
MAGLASLGLFASAAIAHPANGPTFAALAKIERGQWQLRGTGSPARSICIADPTILFQLRGKPAGCSRLVIENTAASATVNYSCSNGAHGRTTIAVETPRLMRIDSQGVEGGAPFVIEIEARRTGGC